MYSIGLHFAVDRGIDGEVKLTVNEVGGVWRNEYVNVGMPLGRWKTRVKEYMCERGATRGGGDQARRECLARGKWRLFCLFCGMFLEGVRD